MTRPPLSASPPDLPVPVADGACDHLPGTAVPSLPLRATSGGSVDLAALPGRTVVFCFPKMGRPGEPTPPEWTAIPGAKGCTAEACSFRDHAEELRELGVGLFGMSVQAPDEQQEAAERLQLPFPLLSDAELGFARAAGLPTFAFRGQTLLKRATLVIDDAVVTHCFYPVFPPGAHADEVLDWLTRH